MCIHLVYSIWDKREPRGNTTENCVALMTTTQKWHDICVPLMFPTFVKNLQSTLCDAVNIYGNVFSQKLLSFLLFKNKCIKCFCFCFLLFFLMIHTILRSYVLKLIPGIDILVYINNTEIKTFMWKRNKLKKKHLSTKNILVYFDKFI